MGGHRRYSESDVLRIRRAADLVGQGWAVDAAINATAPSAAPPPFEDTRRKLEKALNRLDLEEIDALVAACPADSLPAFFDSVVAGTLRDVDAGWKNAPGRVAAERALAEILRVRLANICWRSGGSSRSVVLAGSVAGDDHDLNAVIGATALALDGWRAVLLGHGVPALGWEEGLDGARPRLVLVSATSRAAARKFLADRPTKRRVQWLAVGRGFRPEDEGSDLAVHAGGAAEVVGVANNSLNKGGKRRAAGG
jgi:hypothetical protein